MNLKYVVTINYYRFEFDESEDAMIFATQAKLHSTRRTYQKNDDEVDITIAIEAYEPETEKKEEE